MTAAELVRFDGKHVVVTGAASGIGAEVARRLAGIGARVTGMDLHTPAESTGFDDFIIMDLARQDAIDDAVSRLYTGGRTIDSLFNVAGVSSGIGNPPLVVRINFLGTRYFTEKLIELIPDGGVITNVSSLAGSGYLDNIRVTTGLVDTDSMDTGMRWCVEHPEALADGGYRLSKEAIIVWGMQQVATLGARGIRINCTAPGVTETPILDQLRSAYGQQYLDSFRTPLGRVCTATEQADVLVFLGSDAASYITGQVIWVDGGTMARRLCAADDETTMQER